MSHTHNVISTHTYADACIISLAVFAQAEEKGILFMPVAGQKRHEGKLLYNFGRATLYIEREVTFVLRPSGQWAPVSLDELIRLA